MYTFDVFLFERGNDLALDELHRFMLDRQLMEACKYLVALGFAAARIVPTGCIWEEEQKCCCKDGKADEVA